MPFYKCVGCSIRLSRNRISLVHNHANLHSVLMRLLDASSRPRPIADHRVCTQLPRFRTCHAVIGQQQLRRFELSFSSSRCYVGTQLLHLRNGSVKGYTRLFRFLCIVLHLREMSGPRLRL